MEENEIKIGDQTWTTKNLDVSAYKNGDAIPQVQDEESRANLTTGAWCYYENDTENGTTYGKLYNWYAVNDPRGLAPKGYHIPTDAERTILTDNLGDKVGIKSSDLSDWDYYGTKSSRFTGLPGGFRNSFGHFNDIWANGTWWRLSDNFTNNALLHWH
jgi:uncharacterized protein (TIGR02145 family)